MRKSILSLIAVVLIMVGTIIPFGITYSQDADDGCPNCVSEKMIKYVTCFKILGRWSSSDQFVVFGTGNKAKCKSTPNATCDQLSQKPCESDGELDEIIPE